MSLSLFLTFPPIGPKMPIFPRRFSILDPTPLQPTSEPPEWRFDSDKNQCARLNLGYQ